MGAGFKNLRYSQRRDTGFPFFDGANLPAWSGSDYCGLKRTSFQSGLAQTVDCSARFIYGVDAVATRTRCAPAADARMDIGMDGCGTSSVALCIRRVSLDLCADVAAAARGWAARVIVTYFR